MRDAGASAALITDEPPGIVTHRDWASVWWRPGLAPHRHG